MLWHIQDREPSITTIISIQKKPEEQSPGCSQITSRSYLRQRQLMKEVASSCLPMCSYIPQSAMVPPTLTPSLSLRERGQSGQSAIEHHRFCCHIPQSAIRNPQSNIIRTSKIRIPGRRRSLPRTQASRRSQGIPGTDPDGSCSRPLHSPRRSRRPSAAAALK